MLTDEVKQMVSLLQRKQLFVLEERNAGRNSPTAFLLLISY